MTDNKMHVDDTHHLKIVAEIMPAPSSTVLMRNAVKSLNNNQTMP